MFVHTQGPKLRTRGEEGPATLNPPNSGRRQFAPSTEMEARRRGCE